MLRLLSLGDTEVRSQGLRRFVRSTTAVEILCILLVALVLIWSKAPAAQVRPCLALIAVFGAGIVMFRARRFFPRQTQIKLSIESWTMMLFITGVLWFTGKLSSSLLNLYLLPIVLSALTLGRAATMVQIGAIFVSHMLMAGADPNVDVFSLLYASQAVGTLTPFFLVAYLTTSLSADVNEAREHLENLAQIDELTGSLNMRAFNEVLHRQHLQLEKEQGVYAVIVIDIDKLKSINETFGHDAGNSAIVLVSQSIQRSIRATDSGARLSAGEFAVLLPLADPETADIVVKRIRHQVYNTTLDVRSRMIRCTVSIGVANYPKDGRDPRELMTLADRRMRRDKELRRPPPAG
jgi:diguanylate cyclase (GGDEF)-like protein